MSANVQAGRQERKLAPKFTLCDCGRVASRAITEATMTGQFMAVEPTGKTYRNTAIDTWQIRAD